MQANSSQILSEIPIEKSNQTQIMAHLRRSSLPKLAWSLPFERVDCKEHSRSNDAVMIPKIAANHELPFSHPSRSPALLVEYPTTRLTGFAQMELQ
jgi:hypothetical protein